MAIDSIYEKGDNLEVLANRARNWFTNNKVKVPSGAANWQRCSVKAGQIPPGTTTASLRKYGFNVTTFIASINEDLNIKAYNYNPLTSEDLINMGYEFISENWQNKHKKIVVKCLKCDRIEELSYGKLQDRKHKHDKYCRYCRNAGGKPKDLSIYNKFSGFDIIDRNGKNLIYKCITCNNTVERTMTHCNNTKYIVCEHCNPKINFGAKHHSDLGYFDSKVEYEAYKILLKYLDEKDIVRQKKYDELFNTKTQHTADFYIPKINLVLEVTTKDNNIGKKYNETAEWKKSVSSIVKFAYTLTEVEDIVRSAMKVAEETAIHRRNVCSCCSIKRQTTTRCF